MPRFLPGFLCLALALAVLAITPPAAFAGAGTPHRADSKLNDWRGDPTDIAGHVQVSRGELIYTDYLYDDYGADVNGTGDKPAFRSTPPTSGDYRYPPDQRYGHNAADIRELRLALDGDGLHGMLALQTLIDRNAAVMTIAIDTDGDESTGAGEWPANAGIATPGADAFVTLTGDDATWTDAAGRTRSIPESVHEGANAIEFDVPAKQLGKLGRAPVSGRERASTTAPALTLPRRGRGRSISRSRGTRRTRARAGETSDRPPPLPEAT